MTGKGSSKPKVVAKPPPAPTKWKINTDGVTKVAGSTESALKNLNTWVKAVGDGKHPITEAKKWDSHYEQMKKKTMEVEGKKGVEVLCCSIRLAEGDRAYFYQIDSIKFVKLLRYGDHKEPSW